MCYRTHGNVSWLAGPWILIGPAVMALGIWQPMAGATHPPTPRPCEAEGVCRPSRATWGWNQTRWRPWPGDEAGLQPRATATPTTDGEEEPFKAFERPAPEEEDQRVKRSQKADSDEPTAPESTAPMDESVPDLPALELEGRMTPQPIPLIDAVALQLPAAGDVELTQAAAASRTLHGVNNELRMASRLGASSPPVRAGAYGPAPTDCPQPLPETESEEPWKPTSGNRDNSATANPADGPEDDMPPSLPASLRRMATGLRSSASTTAPRRQTRPNSGSAQLPQPPAGGVVPVTWQQSPGIGSPRIESMGIGLINPAAAVSVGADEDGLKQAIYYEATE